MKQLVRILGLLLNDGLCVYKKHFLNWTSVYSPVFYRVLFLLFRFEEKKCQIKVQGSGT